MLYQLLGLCVVLPVFSHKTRSSIIVSEFTSKDLITELSTLSNSSDIVVLDLANSNLASLESYRPSLIFDFSESLLYRQIVKEFAIVHSAVLFYPYNSSNLYQKGVFYLHPSPSVEADAIRSLLKYLEWSDFHTISSETARSKAMFSLLSAAPLNAFFNEIDQEVFDRYTAKVVKASGNWKTVALNEEPGASKVFKSLENNRIYKERCGLIVGSRGSRGKFKLGTLAVVEEGLEEAETEADYEMKAILRAIKISEDVVHDFSGSPISNSILLKGLEEQTSNRVVSSRYSILNFKDQWRIIGDIEAERIRTWEEIIFPGNVTEMNNSPPKISISANTGPFNSDGTINFLKIARNLGLQPMVSLVNNDPGILPNYELELYETGCTYELFEPECMKKHLDRIGLVHLSGTNATAVELNSRFFQQNSNNTPQISLVYNNQTLYDKTVFPEVLNTFPSLLFWYSIFPYILKSFGWNQAVVLFNHHVDKYYVSVFLQNSESINFNVLNTDEHRFIPYVKTKDYYEEVKPILEFIQESKCKILVLMVDPYSHLYLMEALYDFGFKRGDLIFIYIGTIDRVIDSPEQYSFDRKKVIEIADGSVSMGIAEYIGKYGQELQKQISSIVDPNSTANTCYMIDSLMLAVRSIDLMIRNGKDFEDFDDLMFFMRSIQFTGCTGRMAIDSGGNGRRDVVYTISNFYMTGDKWNEEIAGSYSHGVMIPLNIEKTIIWPNGITDIPDDTIYEPECGFSPELVKENTESRNLSIIITVSLYSFISVVCVLIWRCCFYFKRDLITTKREMFFEDGVLLYLPLLETAQFLALGPSFSKANYYLALLCSLAIFDFDKVNYFEQDFWTIITIGLGACGLWCISLYITMSKAEQKLPQVFRDLFDVLGYKLMQMFCQLFFVSLNVLALKVFDCKQGIGNDVTESFLKHDCRTNCWEEKQLYYVIGACAVLLVYNLFAIGSRIASDELMEYVSVKTQPSYAVWKGIFQLALVGLNFNLKEDNEIVFGVVYCLLFVVWSVFVFITDSTNYKRLNGWIKVLTASVLVHEIIMLGYIALGIPELAVILLQVTILLLCLGIGFYIQLTRSSSMLYRRKGRNFEKLLKFAFTNKLKPGELTEHQLDYANKNAKKYEIECK